MARSAGRAHVNSTLRALCVQMLACSANDIRANPDARLPHDYFWSQRFADLATPETVIALARAFVASQSRSGGRRVCDVVIDVIASAPLRRDDANAPGRYRVWFARPLPPGKAAAAALDLFHTTVPLRDLEAVRIRITAGRDGSVLHADPRHRTYSFHGDAALERIDAASPIT